MDQHQFSQHSRGDDNSGSDSDSGDAGNKASRPKEKKAGRRKINIEFIEDKSRRHITFSKRKAGIMKKAYELSTLTGTQILLLVASETGHVYTFATPKLQPLITKPDGKNLIQKCLNSPDEANQNASPPQAGELKGFTDDSPATNTSSSNTPSGANSRARIKLDLSNNNNNNSNVGSSSNSRQAREAINSANSSNAVSQSPVPSSSQSLQSSQGLPNNNQQQQQVAPGPLSAASAANAVVGSSGNPNAAIHGGLASANIKMSQLQDFINSAALGGLPLSVDQILHPQLNYHRQQQSQQGMSSQPPQHSQQPPNYGSVTVSDVLSSNNPSLLSLQQQGGNWPGNANPSLSQYASLLSQQQQQQQQQSSQYLPKNYQ